MGRLRLAGGVLANGAMGRAMHRLAQEGWTVDPLNPLLRWAQGESGGESLPLRGLGGGESLPLRLLRNISSAGGEKNIKEYKQRIK